MKHDYYREAAFSNTLLNNRFGWLQTKLLRSLESLIGAAIRFDPRLAAPGFHIFNHWAIPTRDEASIHFDLQYELIDWDDGLPQPDRSSTFSFTLPIKLSYGGGGINGWDVTYEESLRSRQGSIDALIAGRSKTFFPYTPGIMALHSGHTLHQIASVAEVREGDQRMTLQGHGLRRGTDWIIYW